MFARSLHVLLAAALGAAPAVAGQVLVVAADGTGDFTEILDAVASAQDGDVILVRSGAYLGFVVTDQTVSVIADPLAYVETGPIEVTGLTEDQFVILDGFVVTGADSPGIRVHDSVGHARIQECTILGDASVDNLLDGWPGVALEAVTNAIFVDCTILGGLDDGSSSSDANDGGPGLASSSSDFAVYSCTVAGAPGADGYTDWAEGGTGISLSGGSLFASGSHFEGGEGSLPSFCYYPGDGGTGVRLTGGATATFVAVSYEGGSAQTSCSACFICSCCIPGAHNGASLYVEDGSTFESLPTPEQRSSVEAFQYAAFPGHVTVMGEVRWTVRLARSTTPRFDYQPNRSGVAGVGAPVEFELLGQIGPNGALSALAELGDAGAQQGSVEFTQAYLYRPPGIPSGTGVSAATHMERSDGVLLGTPRATVLVDCTFSPDCDGSGQPDACEILAGALSDCDQDHVPDVCDPAESSILQQFHPYEGGMNHHYAASMSASAGSLAVGAPYEGSVAFRAGRVYVYRVAQDGALVGAQSLFASDAGYADEFGRALFLRGDTLYVGAIRAPGPTATAGAVYAFRRQGDGSWLELAKLMASDGSNQSLFGHSLGGANGRLAVGAPKHGDGAVYLFEEPAPGVWAEVARVTAPGSSERFGASVAMAGDMLVVGAPDEVVPGHSEGAVHVFRRDASGAWNEEAWLSAPASTPVENFGGSVSAWGDRLAVGAAGTWSESLDVSPKRAFVYVRHASGTWSLEAALPEYSGQGAAPLVVLHGSRLWDGFDGGWRVRVYERTTEWLPAGELEPSSFYSPALGTVFAVGPDHVFVADPDDDTSGVNAGAVYTFARFVDCNGNGVPDDCDIADGTSADIDQNGVPDECQG